MQGQLEECKVREAKYDKKYKEVSEATTKLRYLEKERLGKTKSGMGIRALVKLRCGRGKQMLKEKYRLCVFCE